MSSAGTIMLAIMIIVSFFAAVIMSLAATVLLIVILFGRWFERALTGALWRGYDDGGG